MTTIEDIMSTIEEERETKMLWHLQEAVALGYQMACPGSHAIVVKAFPDLFADEADREAISDYLNDEVNIDDNPMVSRGDDGFWVSAWVWAEYSDEYEEDEDDLKERQADAQDE